MTLEEFIESEAQRLFAALGARHGRDIDFYRLLAQRCIAPTQEQMQHAMDAVRRVEEFLGREPVHICYDGMDGMDGMEHLSLPRCKKSKRRARRKSRAKVGAPLMGAKPH
jgi:hypothetical protein